MRGELTKEVSIMWEEFFGREINTRELRLFPYLDYVIKNSQKIDPAKITIEERKFLSELRESKHIAEGATGLEMTKEFYDFMQEVLWVSYVVRC